MLRATAGDDGELDSDGPCGTLMNFPVTKNTIFFSGGTEFVRVLRFTGSAPNAGLLIVHLGRGGDGPTVAVQRRLQSIIVGRRRQR